MTRYKWTCLCAVMLLLYGCGTASQVTMTTKPIKWIDPDQLSVAEPREIKENQIWDIADHTVFYQLSKVLDLGWSVRRIGNVAGIVDERQADNVNALDEVPHSSWYANRHFFKRLTKEELLVGPGHAQPDTTGKWEIYAGKFEGGTAGFTIKDSQGQLYLLKFDSQGNNEMGSAAEVIATKMLYAAGYNVPNNSIVYFDPEILVIGERARVPDGAGGKRPMQKADVQVILDKITVQKNGRLRCVASKFLSGVPVGIFNYDGVRDDDANDRVRHQHRRELRGLRVMGSWMNDADRRAANTLDMYVTDEDGRKFVKHYLIDMGSAFGSNNLMPHLPKYGNEYVWDPGNVGKSLLALGFFKKPWNEPLPMTHPELGYFENETFRAIKWVPTYPNPAFERCTGRDGYWGAKILMSFTDEDIATCVSAGQYSNPEASQELTRLLIERRDMIGRYWFSRVNPLDKFWVDRGGLHFEDLAVSGKLNKASKSTYEYAFLDAQDRHLDKPQKFSGKNLHIPISAQVKAGQYYGVRLRTKRGNGAWSLPTSVYFYAWAPGKYQIVRVERVD
ncbi:MAG: hypothetical protein ACI8V2_001370 [Candidatus Latescibacterota bacterium]|jgi:hypothetical protein